LTPTIFNPYRFSSEDYLIATGGTITQDGDYQIHTFTTNGTFTVTQLATDSANDVVEYLVAGAGAGAGNSWNTWDGRGGGGGAAGGYLSASGFSVSLQAYDIIVGSAGTGSDTSSTPATNGQNSSFLPATPIYDYLGSQTSVGGLAQAGGWEQKQGFQISASENGKLLNSVNVSMSFIDTTPNTLAPDDCSAWIEVTQGANPFSGIVAQSEKVFINYESSTSGYNEIGTYVPRISGTGSYADNEDIVFPFTTPYTLATNDYIAVTTDCTSSAWNTSNLCVGQLTATPQRFYANNSETFWRGGSGSGAAVRMRLNNGIECVGGGFGGTVDPAVNQPSGATRASGGGSPAINFKGEAIISGGVFGYDGNTGAGNGSGGGSSGSSTGVGNAGTVSAGGAAVVGTSNSISGSSIVYCQGGAGGDSISTRNGANATLYGSGGEGGCVTGTAGGSGGAAQSDGGDGFQGVVILRYKYQ